MEVVRRCCGVVRAGYRVCAFWGLLDEPFQVKAICCLCPARGHLA